MPIVTGTGDSDYSPTWKWTDDELLEGGHAEMRKATTEHGEKVVWELETHEHGRVAETEEVVANPRAAGGDPRRLRGVPVVGSRGVGGAIAGTDPLRALIAKERRRRGRRAP